ncbi:MAG: HAD family hydrolase [Tropicimonas sp.]|uniref:HAD family hydrolase n=1 Tax=Tropicimonas sp. TaxID=2067044 RepID=UPI003A8AC259
MTDIDGLLFDKDGTLFDFQATWGGWAVDLVRELAQGEAALAEGLAQRIGLDLMAGRFRRGSLAIAGTPGDIAGALLPALPGWSRGALLEHLIATSHSVEAVPAVPLMPLMTGLRQAGFVLGVATNDAESAARAQLAGIGALGAFDFIAGADSGHGAKPAPGQCLAFCEATGLAPARVAMVGDSTHDLHAGAAAGMVPVAVLTGPATEADLAPHAAAVLPDIGHLPVWLGIGQPRPFSFF